MSLEYSDKPFIANTPDSIADQIIELANINPIHRILEPSAGRGSLIRAIHRAMKHLKYNPSIYVCEMNKVNVKHIQFISYAIFLQHNFLTLSDELRFDRIIMNPPHKNCSDAIHIKRAHRLLSPQGCLVGLIYTDYKTSNQIIYKNFRCWLETVSYKEVEVNYLTIKPGKAVILVINK